MPHDEKRPEFYNYWSILMKHLKGDRSKIFSKEMIWPRQFEIHLPADHKKSCNFNCFYCAGKYFNKSLYPWERTGLELLDNLKGAIPYHIYGGAYTEPLLNPYYLTFLNMTKKYGNHFGMHTNGSLLKELEENQGWLTELARISTDREDYLSVSLDAGTPESHCKTKGLKKDYFTDIIEGIRLAVEARKNTNPKGLAIRVCYLLNEFNSSEEEIRGIIKIAKKIKVDSLRFSIPFASYAQQFDKVREYKRKVEDTQDRRLQGILEPLMSKSFDEKPYIFYISPKYQDVNLFNFKHCIYGYYQITLGADGYFYRCSTVATPTMKHLRLGKITSDLDDFKKMIKKNQDVNFNTNTCFSHGARCNRMGLDINIEYKNWKSD